MADIIGKGTLKSSYLKFFRRGLVVFYLVGVAGMAFPGTRPLFTALIPFALLLSMGILLTYQPRLNDRKTLALFFLIFLAGFLVEMVGVNTGKIFGGYHYGAGLGLKVNGTPLMIGINWLMLTLAFADLTQRTGVRGWLTIPVASVGMVLYDLVLEQVAPYFDMWNWEGGSIPLQNYMAWFLIALVFQFSLKKLHIPVKNPVAPVVLLCQFFFFSLLLLFFKISG